MSIIKEKTDYFINQFLDKYNGDIVEYFISNSVTNSLISSSIITSNRTVKPTQEEYVLEDITNKLILPYEEILDCYPKFKYPKDNSKGESIYIILKSGVMIEFFSMKIENTEESLC